MSIVATVVLMGGALSLSGCARDVSAPSTTEGVAVERAAHVVANKDGTPEAQRDGERILAQTSLTPGAASAEPEEPSSCPDGMVLVDGSYCPKVRHRCLRYLDSAGKFRYYRCAEYAQPAECLKPRVPMRFCIDRDEYRRPGETLPANHMSWTDGRRLCREQGKRLCLEEEYNFACEGEEMRPYPYGWKRDASACNADRVDIIDAHGKLKDLRAPAGAYPRCESPFGVRDLAGNLEEFVTQTGSKPAWPAMKGAYWQPSRNFCRANQTTHDHHYNGTETGFRCCASAD